MRLKHGKTINHSIDSLLFAPNKINSNLFGNKSWLRIMDDLL